LSLILSSKPGPFLATKAAVLSQISELIRQITFDVWWRVNYRFVFYFFWLGHFLKIFIDPGRYVNMNLIEPHKQLDLRYPWMLNGLQNRQPGALIPVKQSRYQVLQF
jgi:hypothetical protein